MFSPLDQCDVIASSNVKTLDLARHDRDFGGSE